MYARNAIDNRSDILIKDGNSRHTGNIGSTKDTEHRQTNT